MRFLEMTRWRILNLCACLAFVLATIGNAYAADETRVLSIGGSITEIVYALGEEDRLVARDTTSTFPEAANNLPDVGYMRALSPEGVLSVEPDFIISEEGAGPPEVIDVLKAAGIPFVEVADTYDATGILEKIRIVGEALGAEDAAAALAHEVERDLAAAQSAAEAIAGEPKRVLFVLSTANDRIMASGTNTAADGIIKMAGGVNAIDDFEGYKPLTDEAISIAAPDVILMMDRGGDHGSTAEDLFALPSMATTPAAASQSLVQINGLLLLGFGPRTGDAVRRLSEALARDAG